MSKAAARPTAVATIVAVPGTASSEAVMGLIVLPWSAGRSTAAATTVTVAAATSSSMAVMHLVVLP